MHRQTQQPAPCQHKYIVSSRNRMKFQKSVQEQLGVIMCRGSPAWCCVHGASRAACRISAHKPPKH